MRRAEAPARRLQCELEDAYEGDSDPTRVDRVHAMLLAFEHSVLIDACVCNPTRSPNWFRGANMLLARAGYRLVGKPARDRNDH
jgi:hypothetical protein